MIEVEYTLCLMSEITLVSEDEVSFSLSREAAKNSCMLRLLMQDEVDTTEVRVPEASSSTLSKIVQWCQHYENEPQSQSAELALDDDRHSKKYLEISEWEQDFYTVDQELLFEIILASHLLEIPHLTHVGCKVVANMIKGKSPEEIRKTFNIINDFTPEEEDQIRREYEWAEDCGDENSRWLDRTSFREGRTIIKAQKPEKVLENTYKRVFKKIRRLLDYS